MENLQWQLVVVQTALTVATILAIADVHDGPKMATELDKRKTKTIIEEEEKHVWCKIMVCSCPMTIKGTRALES